jgi:hypothetical protein
MIVNAMSRYFSRHYAVLNDLLRCIGADSRCRSAICGSLLECLPVYVAIPIGHQVVTSPGPPRHQYCVYMNLEKIKSSYIRSNTKQLLFPLS